MMTNLDKEAENIKSILDGKIISDIKRFNTDEILLQFSDGTRFYINKKDPGLEFSITDG